MQSSVSQNDLIEKLKGMLVAGKVGAKCGGNKKKVMALTVPMVAMMKMKTTTKREALATRVLRTSS